MIDAKLLKDDLVAELKVLERDLRSRIDELPDLKVSLEAEWSAARDANRTAETFETWADQVITQAGVHWLLACVFLRFIEDNQLIERPWLAGTPASGRLALARDRHDSYFRDHPHESDREYLLAAFRDSARLPGLGSFFDEAHNPLFRLAISGDAAMRLRSFWARTEGATGLLLHDFTDPDWNTRFLGDLYQDLSEATRKRYALLQTPEFVEEFILDRTLTPAIAEFGFRETRLIDPTCGSGHFLLGAFHRLVAEWQRHEPGLNPRAIAQHALDNVAGVDLNPFAIAIARFRLMVAALRVAGTERLSHAPNFKLNLAIGDSLLHGPRFGLTETDDMFASRAAYAGTGLEHAYASEDLDQARKILGRQYHGVVGNPPYIVVKDAALNAAYRGRYTSCHRQYSLGCPFTERFFELALPSNPEGKNAAGYVGLITTNSFMKREFGAKLIEQVLPRLDLTHVIDTSGAYIPGHGTPTVILFGRHRPPVAGEVRTVMGIKGEPSTPEDPAQGQVWTAITRQVDAAGSESAFVSVVDTPRATFGKHPWSIGGGGAGDVLQLLNESAAHVLDSLVDAIGFYQDTHADELFVQPTSFFNRRGCSETTRPSARGDGLRDWSAEQSEGIWFPYDEGIEPWSSVDYKQNLEWLWPFRTTLWARSVFGGQTYRDAGRPWWDYHQFPRDRARANRLIAFAEIATHNHFVLDRGGKVFNRTAPVIKLPADATEDDHLGLLGLLNSSVCCFWMKQVCHQKQMMGGDGIRISERSKVPYQFGSTRVEQLPLPIGWQRHPLRNRLVELGRIADACGRTMNFPTAREVIDSCIENGQDIRKAWADAQAARRTARAQAILVQEEIDFVSYRLYGLTTDDSLLGTMENCGVNLEAGQRPFCIASQKNVDGFDVPAAIPSDWPEELRSLWKRRMDAIKAIDALRIIEEPHYKRRWIGRQGLFNHGARADEMKSALREALLDRLEAPHLWPANDNQPPQLTTTAKLADRLSHDTHFLNLAALYTGRADVDLGALVAELVAAESVPFLPVLRYAETGLRKRGQWEDTWELQRREDAGEAVGTIPVPPKYIGKDFIRASYWTLRGGLDVPKERFVSYPGCERGADPSLPIAWAGWNHLQQATALATYLLDMKDNEGWPRERLLPLLAGLLELVPWLKQWHNDLDPAFGERMGHYYEGFVTDQTRELGYTLADLRAWKPAPTTARRGRKSKA